NQAVPTYPLGIPGNLSDYLKLYYPWELNIKFEPGCTKIKDVLELYRPSDFSAMLEGKINQVMQIAKGYHPNAPPCGVPAFQTLPINFFQKSSVIITTKENPGEIIFSGSYKDGVALVYTLASSSLETGINHRAEKVVSIYPVAIKLNNAKSNLEYNGLELKLNYDISYHGEKLSIDPNKEFPYIVISTLNSLFKKVFSVLGNLNITQRHFNARIKINGNSVYESRPYLVMIKQDSSFMPVIYLHPLLFTLLSRKGYEQEEWHSFFTTALVYVIKAYNEQARFSHIDLAYYPDQIPTILMKDYFERSGADFHILIKLLNKGSQVLRPDPEWAKWLYDFRSQLKDDKETRNLDNHALLFTRRKEHVKEIGEELDLIKNIIFIRDEELQESLNDRHWLENRLHRAFSLHFTLLPKSPYPVQKHERLEEVYLLHMCDIISRVLFESGKTIRSLKILTMQQLIVLFSLKYRTILLKRSSLSDKQDRKKVQYSNGVALKYNGQVKLSTASIN
ncbi:MAG: hypothetical protein NTX89_01845, partial [Candidatus Omnitrophica bacterium]|nr:hypothetical protein [Candidatus Omnitrophota bacterium]